MYVWSIQSQQLYNIHSEREPYFWEDTSLDTPTCWISMVSDARGVRASYSRRLLFPTPMSPTTTTFRRKPAIVRDCEVLKLLLSVGHEMRRIAQNA
jgi:hypothetical protein